MRNPRTALTNALTTAWENTLHKHYEIGGNSPDINSEAALQAFYWSELRNAIQISENRCDESSMPKNTRIFIEPKLIDSVGKVLDIRPDLIVCRNRTVIAAIELKYIPRLDLSLVELEGTVSTGSPFSGLLKDLRSLVRMNELAIQGGVKFVHDRYRGQFESAREEFYFSTQTLFVWAGVHSPIGEQDNFDAVFNKFAELEYGVPTLADMRFLELHAATAAGKAVRFKYFYSGTPAQ